MNTHTIMGAGGVIGRELARILPAYADRIRLVSRHPEKVNATDELLAADLMDAPSVAAAVKGSDVVYLTVGLPYRLGVWQQDWPRLMTNVIDACIVHQAALIFFDNIYCYGRVAGPITEQSPMAPSSRKGKVRVELARMLEEAWQSRGLRGAIVRAADFYGQGADSSIFHALVLGKFKQGKNAQWLCDDRVRYTMTYTPDAALGTAMVGHNPDTWQQVWHLPSSTEELSSGDLITMAAELASMPSHRTLLKKNMLRMAGLFDKTVREMVEMTYQYQYDYIFDSGKFERYFHLSATPYQQGLSHVLGVTEA